MKLKIKVEISYWKFRIGLCIWKSGYWCLQNLSWTQLFTLSLCFRSCSFWDSFLALFINIDLFSSGYEWWELMESIIFGGRLVAREMKPTQIPSWLEIGAEFGNKVALNLCCKWYLYIFLPSSAQLVQLANQSHQLGWLVLLPQSPLPDRQAGRPEKYFLAKIELGHQI